MRVEALRKAVFKHAGSLVAWLLAGAGGSVGVLIAKSLDLNEREQGLIFFGAALLVFIVTAWIIESQQPVELSAEELRKLDAEAMMKLLHVDEPAESSTLATLAKMGAKFDSRPSQQDGVTSQGGEFQRAYAQELLDDQLGSQVFPKVRLIFDPSDQNFVRPGTLVMGPEWRYRIGVINLTGASLTGCQLRLEKADPLDDHTMYLDQPMGDRLSSSDGTFSVHLNDDGKPSIYVDALHEIFNKEPGIPLLKLTYAPLSWHSENIKRGKLFNGSNYEFTFVLQGDGIRPARLRLSATLDPERKRYVVKAVPL